MDNAGDTAVLTCLAVTKRYGQLTVLQGFDLKIAAGTAVCLRGANGAGKSTLIRCVVGLEPADGGDVLVDGQSVLHEPIAAKQRLGYAADEPHLYPYLTATEHLRLWAALRGETDQAVNRGTEIAATMALRPVLDRQVRTYSRGMRQQLAFVGAVFHDPPLIVLDEPFTATDDDSTAAAITYLKQRQCAGRAVLFSTHNPTLRDSLATTTVRLGSVAGQPSPTTPTEQRNAKEAQT
jgi:ABC-2 type transport system ATP-binding protein